MDQKKLDAWLQAYTCYSQKEFTASGHSLDLFNVDQRYVASGIFPIAVAEGCGAADNYSLEVEYDIMQEREIIRVYNDVLQVVKYNAIPIESYTTDLVDESCGYEQFIDSANTGIDYDDMDLLCQYYQSGDDAAYQALQAKMDVEVMEQNHDLSMEQSM